MRGERVWSRVNVVEAVYVPQKDAFGCTVLGMLWGWKSDGAKLFPHSHLPSGRVSAGTKVAKDVNWLDHLLNSLKAELARKFHPHIMESWDGGACFIHPLGHLYTTSLVV